MADIKFGTDGWRAIIAKDYTVENVKRVSEATAKWMLKKGMSKVVIGYDCRFGGKMFSDVTAKVFANFGIETYLSTGFVSTPMVSLGVVKLEADMGVVITASHNPPSYNGYKLKSAYGGPTIPSEISEIELNIPEDSLGNLDDVSVFEQQGVLKYVNLEDLYIEHIQANFDLDTIRKSGIGVAYDAMYGAGQNAMKRLLPDAHFLHCVFNPSFYGQAPEPIHKNLKYLSHYIKEHPEINVGIANDGDADRIGMYDDKGNFVDSHHLLLILLMYMAEEKKMKGKVVVSFSVTSKLKQLAEKYGCELEVTKIGFKYIAEIMIKDDVLVGGEESGGIAVKGHIPERDGIWMGLLILEYMAKTGKSINQLIEDVYAVTGSFAFNRDDLHINEDLKQKIVQKCKNGEITSIGNHPVQKTETTDGYKFYLENDSWIMVRPSGTEPVLRVYCQAPDKATVRALLDDAHKSLQA